MSSIARVLAALAVVLSPGVAGGCVAGALPPSRTEIGTVMVAGQSPSAGARISAGAHLASATTHRSMPVDVGVGYVFERLESTGPASSRLALSDAAGGPVATGHDTSHRDAHGGYLEVSRALARSGAHRSWLGARTELSVRPGQEGGSLLAGAYARVAWELFGTGSSSGAYSDDCGGGWIAAHGTFALGLYLESGYRWVESESGAFVTSAGLSLRLPFLAGLVVDVCRWCK